MPVEIGGEKAWRKYVKGDIGVSFQWVNNEPAMILFPVRRQKLDAGAFVICLSAAHLYAQNDGHPALHYCIPKAIEAAKIMGMSVDKLTIHRIVDVILDAMPDLVSMPPEPNWAQIEKRGDTAGELVIKVDGETIMEREVSTPTPAELGAMH